MKLFIFKPHDDWSYCGGGRVVIAEDYQKAIELFPGDKFFKSDDDSIGEDVCDVWTLVEEFEVKADEPKIVLNEYNWG